MSNIQTQVEALCQAGNFQEARRLVEDFLIENEANNPDIQDTYARLDEQVQQAESEFEERTETGRRYLRRGNVDFAFDEVESLLREYPQSDQAIDLLCQLIQQDGNFRQSATDLLQDLDIDPLVLNQAPPPLLPAPPTASTALRYSEPSAYSPAQDDPARQPVPPSHEPRVPPSSVESSPPLPAPPAPEPPLVELETGPNEADLLKRYEEGMRLYRRRYHEEAIELFNQIIMLLPEEAQLYQDAITYRDHAEVRLEAGEVPLEAIPYEALDSQSQATSAERLGDYQKAEELLSKAIRLCSEGQIRFPPDWTQKLDTVRLMRMAQDLKTDGEVALARGDFDTAKQHWLNAMHVLDDPSLGQKLQDLDLAKAAITAGRVVADAPLSGSIKQRATQLMTALTKLRAAQAAFPEHDLLRHTLQRLESRGQDLSEQIERQIKRYLDRVEQAKDLTERRSWLEKAQQKIDNILSFTGDDDHIQVYADQVEQELSQLTNIEQQLERAETQLRSGGYEGADLGRILDELKGVQRALGQDQRLYTLAHDLRNRYLDAAERRLDSWQIGSQSDEDLVRAEDYVNMARDPFFEFLGYSERSSILQRKIRKQREVRQAQVQTQEAQARSKATKQGIIWIIIIVIIMLMLIPVGNVLYLRAYLPLVAPTATPTLTLTPTPIDTATTTFTPTPSPSPILSPTPSPTPTNLSTLTLTPTSTPTFTPSLTPTVTPTSIVFLGEVRFQVWVYSVPETTPDNRVSFVEPDQAVDIVEIYQNEAGEDWYKITWQIGDSLNSGWVAAQNVQISGLK